MGNEENTSEKGSVGKSATSAGVAVAMIGLCSIVAKGVFDHFDEIKLLLSPKAVAISSPAPLPTVEPTAPQSSPVVIDHPAAAQVSYSAAPPQGTPLTKPLSQLPAISDREPVRQSADDSHPPLSIVQGYYDAINRRSLPGAYDRLSAGFRARRSLEDFSKLFSDTAAITIKEASEVARSSDTATVSVRFVELDADHRSQQWVGNVYLVCEQVGWRIERTDLKRL